MRLTEAYINRITARPPYVCVAFLQFGHALRKRAQFDFGRMAERAESSTAILSDPAADLARRRSACDFYGVEIFRSLRAMWPF
jgi:hypothetical protein